MHHISQWMERAVAVLLAICLLPLCAYANNEPVISAAYTCTDDRIDVGSVLHFSLTGENCAVMALMEVSPDGKQTYYQGGGIDIPLLQQGLYVFIAYGANGSDASKPGFQRCMSAPIQVQSGDLPSPEEVGDAYTLEMRYVNQFYDSSWRPYGSQEGAALQKWLDMSECGEDSDERLRSGYLMLEKEYLHQDGTWYKAGHGFVTASLFTFETVGTLGFNLLVDHQDNISHKEKFDEAGKSAYLYYCQMTDLYVNYTAALINEMAQMQQVLELVQEFAEDGVKVYSNTKNMNDLFAVCDKERQVFMLVPDGNVGTPQTVKILDFIDYDAHLARSPAYYGILEAGGTAREFSMTELLQVTTGNQAVVADFSGYTGSLDATEIASRMRHDFGDAIMLKAGDDINIVTLTDFNDILPEYRNVQDLLDMPNANPEVKNMLNKLEDALTSDVRASKWSAADTAELGLNVVGAALDWWTYVSDKSAKREAQKVYYRALMDVSDSYIQMLMDWRDATDNSAIKDKKALRAAINAMIEDIAATRNATLEEAYKLAQKDASAFTGGKLTSALLSTLSIISSIPQIKSAIAGVTAQATAWVAGRAGVSAASVSAVVSKVAIVTVIFNVGGIVLGLIAGNYLSFHDSVQALYQMKQTLCDTVEAQLRRYGSTQTHQDACAIIESLRTMRSIKITGEQLIALYYLDGFFDGYNVDDMPLLGTIFWNEFLTHYTSVSLNIDDHIQRAIALYEIVVYRLLDNGTYRDAKILGASPVWTKGLISVESIIDRMIPRMKPLPRGQAYARKCRSLYAKTSNPVTYRNEPLVQLPPGFAHLPYGLPRLMYDRGERDFWSGYIEFEVKPPLSGMPQATSTLLKEQEPYNDVQLFQEGWRTRLETTFTRSDTLYLDEYFIYKRDGMEIALNKLEYDAYILMQKEVNLMLNDSEKWEEEYGFLWMGVSEQQKEIMRRLEWIKITRSYIMSLKMFGE